jgi:hypothetical protein
MLAGPGSDVHALADHGVTWAMWGVNHGEPVDEVLAFAGAGPTRSGGR